MIKVRELEYEEGNMDNYQTRTRNVNVDSFKNYKTILGYDIPVLIITDDCNHALRGYWIDKFNRKMIHIATEERVYD